MQELWFQQDGETCHTDHATIDLLTDTLDNRVDSHFGLLIGLQDLTPLDFSVGIYEVPSIHRKS